MVGLATTILLEFPLCVTLFFLFEPFCTYIVHPPRQKGGKERPGGKPLDPGERPKDSGLGFAIPTRRPVCLGLYGPLSFVLNGFWSVP